MADFGNGWETFDDAAKVVTTYDRTGAVVGTRPYTAAETANAAADAARLTEGANRTLLVQRAKAFQTATATYLALGNPTTAQTTAQVQRNAKAINALVKIVLNDLADTAGTT